MFMWRLQINKFRMLGGYTRLFNKTDTIVISLCDNVMESIALLLVRNVHF